MTVTNSIYVTNNTLKPFLFLIVNSFKNQEQIISFNTFQTQYSLYIPLKFTCIPTYIFLIQATFSTISL